MKLSDLQSAKAGARPFDDLPWLCRDAEGEVAIFTSAGFGQVPLEMFDDMDRYLEAMPLIEEAISQRGHYVFDYEGAGWLDRSKPYTRVSEPLPLAARIDLRGLPHVVCSSVRFRDAQQFRVDDHFQRTNAFAKSEEPNQPLQRNASTGSASNFESPARHG